MALSRDDVERIAHLARIEIGPHDAEQARAQLAGIFGLIEQMRAVDTGSIEPMAHAREVTLRLRADKATEPDQRAAFQAIAPEVEAGLYLVPKVIE